MNSTTTNKSRSVFPWAAATVLLGIALVGWVPNHILRPAPKPLAAHEQAALTPEEAFLRLKQGNERFLTGKSHDRSWLAQIQATQGSQHPFAFVLSCIDSRTSSEIVFDQGLGDLFNARIAGNVLSADILGSMEFACQVAGAKVISVVGHSKCGAIIGACKGVQMGNLTGLLAKIQPCVAEAKADHPGVPNDDPALVAEVTEKNVRQVLAQIQKESAILRDLLASGKLQVVGGIQSLDTGKVQFLQP